MDESVKKSNTKKEPSELEEETTGTSVWGSSGPPVGPAFAAKKGDWKAAKKPIWKGGTILQKEEDYTETVLRPLEEVNKVKFVKGGKYMKIKDKCSKYNNGPHCSQGAIDDPLILSDKTFENIDSISERTGLTGEQIIDKINNYLKKG